MKRFHTLIIVIICHALTPVAGSAEHSPYTAQPGTATFDLPDIKGLQHKLQDYRGQVILVNFWATWCPPCIQEMPALEKLEQELSGQPF